MSDRPAPASSDDVSKLRRLLELKIKYTSEPDSPWPALELELCDSHESLRQLLAERDMEIERLPADNTKPLSIRSSMSSLSHRIRSGAVDRAEKRLPISFSEPPAQATNSCAARYAGREYSPLCNP